MTSKEATPPSTVTATPEGDQRNFGQHAARLSWVAVLLACFVVSFSRSNPQSATLLAMLGSGLVVIGALSGLVGLCSIPKFGASRVLAPSLIGLATSAAVLSAAVPSFIEARNRARVVESTPEDIAVTLVISADQLAEGGRYDIEVEGKPVSLVIPAGTDPMARLRIPAGSAHRGDLIFEFDVVANAPN